MWPDVLSTFVYALQDQFPCTISPVDNPLHFGKVVQLYQGEEWTNNTIQGFTWASTVYEKTISLLKTFTKSDVEELKQQTEMSIRFFKTERSIIPAKALFWIILKLKKWNSVVAWPLLMEQKHKKIPTFWNGSANVKKKNM